MLESWREPDEKNVDWFTAGVAVLWVLTIVVTVTAAGVTGAYAALSSEGQALLTLARFDSERVKGVAQSATVLQLHATMVASAAYSESLGVALGRVGAAFEGLTPVASALAASIARLVAMIQSGLSGLTR